ncbi:MAG: glycosyltransferase family 10 [Candidatus Thermoplasmatota archaeon]|nr:glycosyltransferase family 10 [Candidatus Thermoplasmatota archaeon]
MIRIKLTMPCWPIERQSPNHSGIWDNCHFIINQQVSECDYWVVCESLIDSEETLCPKENTILITHEPPTLGKYKSLFLKQFATVITCHKNIRHKNPIFQQQGLPWHVGRRQRNHVNLSWSKDYDELVSIDRFHKDKKISVITSSKDGTVGHRQRLEFIRILKDYFGERIDIFGRGINEIEDKWDALNRYKYHIALENSALEDYWTEKLSDAYLAGCYPIYYGCPNIEKYFDISSLAKIDITRPDQAIHIIESCLKEHRYENAQQYIKNARKDILNKCNVFPMVCSLINKDQRNLDNVKYVKIKMLPRYAKPLSFLIKNLANKYNLISSNS